MTGNVLKPNDNGTGYLQAHFRVDGKRIVRSIHRLVLTHFNRAPRKGEECMHEDNNKYNNELSNLKWGTTSQNILHCYSTGARKAPRGHLSKRSKLSKSQVLNMRAAYKKGSVTMKKLGVRFGIATNTVSYIINERTYYDY